MDKNINLIIQNPDPKESPSFFKRGFMSIRFSLIKNGSEIGYLKVALLTPENFKLCNPTIWHYAEEWLGHRINLEAVKEENDEEIFNSLCGSYTFRLSYEDKNLPKEEKIKELNKIKIKLEEKLDQEISQPLFNRPYVDYISVEEQYRGQGLGKKLYLAANEYFSKIGYTFTSSSIQSEQAQRIWEKMEQEGLVDKKDNLYIFKRTNKNDT